MNLAPEIPPRFAPMFPYQSLDQVQRIVLKTLIGTDQNVVIGAPTSCGKTAMMEFAIVRALTTRPQNAQKPTIVYLCPLKKLCSEKLDDWRVKGQKCGFIANELTGDSEGVNELQILRNSDVLCATTEKFDWLTRRFHYLLSNVRLLLVDEVHSISERNRGPTLEAFITRIKLFRMNESVSSFRIVAVSATIPNIGDLKEWLGPNCTPFNFGDEYRPVPLYKEVVAYSSCGNAFGFDIMLNSKMSEILQKYSDNKPSLIFCISRKCAEKSGSSLAKYWPTSSDHELLDAANRCQDGSLRDMLRHCVAFHNSGLSLADRALVERLFMSQKIKALFSTTSLAQGVNLPAHLVVIKGTQFCFGKDGSVQELEDNLFQQMIGRAGRRGMDTFGRAVVLTKHETAGRYKTLAKLGMPLESKLASRIPETLNAELVLSGINSMKAAKDWLKKSFLYVRLSQNLPHYLEQLESDQSQTLNNSYAGSISSSMVSSSQESISSSPASAFASANSMSVEEFVNSSVTSAINQLCEIELLTHQPGGRPELQSTSFGRKMAYYCLGLKTMKLLMDHSVDENVNLQMLFDLLAHSDEMASEVLRTEEEEFLDKLRPLSRFQLGDELNPRQAKVFILMPAILSGNSITHHGLNSEAGRFFRIATRLANCLLDIIELRSEKFLKVLHTASLFCKIMNAQLWHDSELVSKQLHGIGPAYSRSLAEAGLDSFEKIASASEGLIQNVCQRNYPFGRDVKNGASEMPRYSIELKQLDPFSSSFAHILVTCHLVNVNRIRQHSVRGLNHKIAIFVGDSRNNKVFGMWRLTDKQLVERNGIWTREFSTKSYANVVSAYVISLEVVGVDAECQFEPTYLEVSETLSGGPPVGASTPVKKDRTNECSSGRKREFNTSASSQYESDDDDTFAAKLAKCSNLDLDGETATTAATFNEDAYESEDDEAVLEKLFKLENDNEAAYPSTQGSSVLQLSSQEFDSEDDESVMAKLANVTDEDGNNI